MIAIIFQKKYWFQAERPLITKFNDEIVGKIQNNLYIDTFFIIR